MPTPLYTKWNSFPPMAKARVEKRLGVLTPAHPLEFPVDEFTRYACTDAVVTYGVERELLPLVEAMGLSEISAIDHSIIPMVVDMTQRGMMVDQQHFLTVGEALKGMMADQQGVIEKWLGEHNVAYIPDNVGSDDQVAHLLFNTLHLPYLYMTDSGARPSVNAETLKTIEFTHPVAGMVLQWRELETLLTTFALPLLERARNSPDGKIHPNILLTRQPSGRLTTKEPNLLAIPTRTVLGRLIREGFVPSPGYSFLSVDFSNLEVRILTHLSGCQYLIGVFDKGLDPFRTTAATLWGCKPEEVSQENRNVTKNNFYGIIYGITPGGLAMRLQSIGLKEWTEAKVADFMKEFFKLCPEVGVAISRWHAEARSTGMIRDMFGRARLVPQVRSIKKHVREEGLRQAQNHPMQSTAAGIMKLAMRKMWDAVVGKGHYGKEIWVDLQIHDELLSEVKNGEETTWGHIVCGIMESAVTLKVPMKAKFAWSPSSWGAIEK